MYFVCVWGGWGVGGGIKPQGVSKGCCWGSSSKRNMHHPWLSSRFCMLQIQSHQTRPLATAPPDSPRAYRHPRSSKCLLDTVFRLFSEWHKHSKSPLQALHKKGKTLLPGDELQNMKVSGAQNSSIWTYLLWNHLYYGNCAVLNNNNSNNKKSLIIMSQTLRHHPQSKSFQWEAARWARGKMSEKP